MFVTLEARDPTLASVVHDVRYYAPQDICFGMRYADIVSVGRDGTQVAELRRIGALEPDVEDRQEPVPSPMMSAPGYLGAIAAKGPVSLTVPSMITTAPAGITPDVPRRGSVIA